MRLRFSGYARCVAFSLAAAAWTCAGVVRADTSCPLGPLDATVYNMDGDSLRLKWVKPGGPMDDSGARARDEIIGVQVDNKFAQFRNSKATLRYFGEALDLATGNGGQFRMKMRLGRDQGMCTVAVPKMGSFVPGQVIDKTTVDGKETKNEKLFKNASKWLIKNQAADGLVGGSPLATLLAGLAWMNSPDINHQKQVDLIAKYCEGVLGQDLKVQVTVVGNFTKEEISPPSSGPQEINSRVAGPHLYGWAILFLSEYNWRHPSPERKAILQRACDELVEQNFNPTYFLKDPSKQKDDKYGNFYKKPYEKAHWDFAAAPQGDLAMAMWCWTHCAITSGVKINNDSVKAGCLWAQKAAYGGKGGGVFAKDKKGNYAFGVSPEQAACLAQALCKTDSAELTAIGRAMAVFVAQSPLDVSNESEIIATMPILLRAQGIAGYRQHFPAWRWYLSLMMQSAGEAKLVPFVEAAYCGDQLTASEHVSNAISVFLMAAPARKLMMTGGTAPVTDADPYKIGDTGKTTGSGSN